MSTYKEIMEDFGDRIVYDAKKTLKQKGKYNTGSLYNSIKSRYVNDTLEIEMNDYGTYVDQGRRPGSWVPVNALNKWLKQRGIDLKYSYVINKSIRDHGIKATHFFTDAYETNMEDFNSVLDVYINKLLDDGLEGI